MPVVLVYPADGSGPEWLEFGGSAIFANLPDILYDSVPFDPGTEIYADITVSDYGGNDAVAAGTLVLE